MADLKKLKLSSYCGVAKCFLVDDQGDLTDERKNLLERLKINFGLTEKEHELEWKNAIQDFFVKKAIKRKEDQKKDNEEEKKEEKKEEKTLQKAQSFAFPMKGSGDFRSMVLNKVDLNKVNEEKKLKFGTPRHKNCKDKAFEKAGFVPSLKIWRIENFKVVQWPEKDYGSFYEGDSYLVLNTYKKDLDGYNNSLGWDIHFWLGKDSTRDETGTAALKAIELDDTLGGRATQYREVQGHESQKFLSLFPNGRKLMSGGIDSGFNEVKPQEYKPRLFHIKGSKSKQKCDEVPLSCESLNEGDAFVLDAGLLVYIWEGKKASRPEKMRATHISNDIKSARKNVKIIREELGNESKEFWDTLGGKTRIKTAEEGGDDEEVISTMKHILYQLSDQTGQMEFTKVKEGDLFYEDFKTEDVFIADVNEYIIVWIGNGTTEQERKSSLVYGQKYLDDNNKPDWIPLVKMIEGSESTLFWSYIKKDSKVNQSPLTKKVFGAFGKKENTETQGKTTPKLSTPKKDVKEEEKKLEQEKMKNEERVKMEKLKKEEEEKLKREKEEKLKKEEEEKLKREQEEILKKEEERLKKEEERVRKEEEERLRKEEERLRKEEEERLRKEEEERLRKEEEEKLRIEEEERVIKEEEEEKLREEEERLRKEEEERLRIEGEERLRKEEEERLRKEEEERVIREEERLIEEEKLKEEVILGKQEEEDKLREEKIREEKLIEDERLREEKLKEEKLKEENQLVEESTEEQSLEPKDEDSKILEKKNLRDQKRMERNKKKEVENSVETTEEEVEKDSSQTNDVLIHSPVKDNEETISE